MDPAAKLNSRRLFSLGTLCVALVVAANTVFVLWLNGSEPDRLAENGGDAFPLEIRLLEERKPGTGELQAGLAEAVRGSETHIAARSGVEGEGSLNSSHPSDSSESPSPFDSAKAESQALACRVWGPIGAEEVVEDLRQKIELAGDVIDVQSAEMSSDPDYLVYVDTDQNIDNARRLLKELESQSVDAYVISGGALMNSVSAGVFSRRSRAESHQQRLIDMGYQPILEPLERSQTVYHLYARVPQGFETDGHASKDCAAIASLR